MASDAYATLGVARSATTDEIRAAYRARSRELHPDRNPSPNANRLMAAVNAAYEVLSDPERRAALDATIGARLKGEARKPPEEPKQPEGRTVHMRTRPVARQGPARAAPPRAGRGSIQPERLPNWYAFLGVSRDASTSEVLAAGLSLRDELRRHAYAPEVADKLYLQLREAQEVLTTRRDRDFYDGALAGYPPPPGEYARWHADLFSFLGVRRTASPERVAEAVTALSGKVPLRSREYDELETAWRTLRDPGRRKAYEATLA
ncbi:MAG: DnaJ domain-containing protein [Dehalococcoidia bacterium]